VRGAFCFGDKQTETVQCGIDVRGAGGPARDAYVAPLLDEVAARPGSTEAGVKRRQEVVR